MHSDPRVTADANANETPEIIIKLETCRLSVVVVIQGVLPLLPVRKPILFRTLVRCRLPQQCFCGTDSDDFDRRGASTACTMACAGDDSETCGGNNAISVYYGDSVPDSTSATFTYLGCFADSVAARVLSVSAMKNDADLTIDVRECVLYTFVRVNVDAEHRRLLFWLRKPCLCTN